MGGSVVLAALLVGGGLALLVTGSLMRINRRQASLLELLDLDGGEREVPVEVITESPEAPPVSKLTVRIGEMIGKLDTRGSLTKALISADMPLRAGEYLFLVGLTGIVFAVLIGFIVGSPASSIGVLALVAAGAWIFPKQKASRRKDKMRNQLPDAFSLIASSVAAGHTFLRSIQLLGEQVPEPLARELNRVVNEVTLGSNLVDALEALAVRSEITELSWAVKAVRIQQTTGGQLSEILHTLADFMRARDEVYREVQVLTAEGRFSGYVLEGLPFVVTAFLLIVQPTYLTPLVHGLGLLMLAAAVVMMLVGHSIIRKLIRIEV